MTKNEFLQKTNQVKSNIGGWKVAPGSPTKAAYSLGCYFDQKKNDWIIYITDERSVEGEYDRAASEEEAYDKLYDLILFHEKLYS